MKSLRRYPYGLIILILIKLWLISSQPITALADNIHDDLLFVKLADYLIHFQWLGPYNNLTLIKGPFYPIWIAFTFLISVPLLLSHHLLYIAATLVTYYAVQPLINKTSLRITLFVFLLFNPATFTFQITRALRDALYPSLVLLVVASAIGLFARRHEPARSIVGWAVTCGLATGACWLTREEGVWILPFLIPVTVWIIITATSIKPRNWCKIAVIMLPLLLPVLAIQGVSLLNFLHYGVYATVELKTSQFKAAYGALSRVKPIVYKPQVPVTKETRQHIYEQSKAFAELQPFFEKPGFWNLGDIGFKNHSAGAEEIGGGWFIWALRDAASEAGYFTSGSRASAFFQRIADEINDSCREKKLDCLEERSSLIPPWRSEFFLPIIFEIKRVLLLLSKFSDLSPDPYASIGSSSNLLLFKDLTQEKITDLVSNQGMLYVRGWAVHTSETLTVSLIDIKTQHIISTAISMPSPDVNQYLISMNQYIPTASHARFETQGYCTYPCALRILGDKGLQVDIPLKLGSITEPGIPLWVHLDQLSDNIMPRQLILSTVKQFLLKKILLIYQLTAPLFGIITCIIITIWFIRLIRDQKSTDLGVIGVCILLAVLARALILAIVEITSFPGIATIYLTPLYPLLLLVYSFFFTDFIQRL